MRAAFLAGLALAGAAALPVLAQGKGVRKCVDAAGRTVYQDAHCAAPRDAAADPARDAKRDPARPAAREPAKDARPAVPAEGAHGAWRGAARLQHQHSAGARDVRADADVEIELLPDGRVRGAVAGTGCRIDGVHAGHDWGRAVPMDLTLSGCADARFNARYAGRLDSPATGASRSRLGLQAIGASDTIAAGGFRDLSLTTIDAALLRR